MRGYAKVLPQFWIGYTGRQIKDIGIEAQLLALYLMTSPHATMIGIYYLPISFVTHETGMTSKAVFKALQALSAIEFCTYDKAMEYVWVHEMALYQIGTQFKQNDNRIKGVNTSYQSLPLLCFLPMFFKKYKDVFWLENPRASEASPKPLRSQEQEQEQELEQDQKIISSLREDVISMADNLLVVRDKLNCPHEEIIKLYHEILTSCPPVRAWNKARQSYLRQRWGENQKHQNLEWWKNYFEYVKQSEFLTGRVSGRNGNPPFIVNLEWLVRPGNFVKVIEGKYHGVVA